MSDNFSRSSATGCGRLARLARSSNVLASMVGHLSTTMQDHR